MATYAKGKKTKLSENFNSIEFDCKGGSCCKATIIDPQLVVYLQAIRDHFGKPITITSGFRCITHNQRVGGAVGSRHTKGDAADIVVKGVAPKEVAKFAESIGIKGIGLYETSADGHFVHIDTRDIKSFWYGQSEKPMSTFGGSSNNSSNTTTNSQLTTQSKITVSLPTLQSGNKNKYVGVAQALLGIAADNVFGADTKKAVQAIQKKKGLKENGVIGGSTWEALFN
jgi:hypothetical protein